MSISQTRGILAAAAWLGVSYLIPGFALAQEPQTAAPQTEQLEKVVRQYILDHPEVLLESLRLFKERAENERREKMRAQVAERWQDLYGADARKDSEIVTVTEFFDYRCGYCRKVAGTVEQIAEFPGVRVVYKDLPILGPDSVTAAKAAIAVRLQGDAAHAALHQRLLKAETLTPEAIGKIATELKLDSEKLLKDMESPEVLATIRRNSELAEAVGIQATPAFAVGKTVVAGALGLSDLQALVESTRAEAKAAAVATPASAVVPAGGND